MNSWIEMGPSKLIGPEPSTALRRKNKLEINLKLRARFVELFGTKERRVRLQNGATVRNLLDALCDSPERTEKIFDNERKNLRPYVAVTKNGRFIIHLEWLDTKLSDGDNVEIFSMVSAG
jgi:MoaD family protein